MIETEVQEELPSFFGSEEPEAEATPEVPEEGAAEVDPFAIEEDEESEAFEEEDEEFSLEEPEEEAAEETEEEPSKGPPKTMPYKRFQKVVNERNELRTHVAELEAVVDTFEQFNDVIKTKYSRFKNPAAVLTADANFMESLEAMAQKDPEVAKAAQKVKTYMESGKLDTPTPQEKPAQARDTRVDLIVEKEARRSVEQVLSSANVTKPMKAIISDYVVGRAEDPASLSEKEIVKLTKAFMKEKGLKLSDVQGPKAEKAEAPKKVKTGKETSATATPSKNKAGEGETKQFANREELLADRAKRLKDVLSKLS